MLFFSPYRYRGQLYSIIYGQAIPSVIGQKSVALTETIERLFGTAKENHGFRYTQMYGKARMEMKVGMTFACLNLKKLARILNKRGIINSPNKPFFTKYSFSY